MWPSLIEQWFDKADTATIDKGLNWYRNVHESARQMAADAMVPLHTVVGVLAALSPACPWERNLFETKGLLDQAPINCTTYRPNVVKARLILAGRDPQDILGGPKVTSFYQLIMNPRDNYRVCVDRHAVRVCTRRKWKSDKEASRFLKSQYERCADAYRIVADRMDLLPHQVQAVTWEVFRNGT